MKKMIAILICALLLTGATAYATVYQVPQPVRILDGAAGVWQVPSIGTSSPVYPKHDRVGQDVVDADDSALIIDYGAGKAILDHNNSVVGNGKWEVGEIRVGDTAWLITEEDTTEYACYMVCEAVNTGHGYRLDGTGLYPHRSSDILCVSCIPDTENGVYIAFFKYVGLWG